MTAAPGAVLSSRQALTGPIAAGGMGEVWAATDIVLDQGVAVKHLRDALNHPNITTVSDDSQEDGSAYLVVEVVAGQPLSQIISENAPLPAQVTGSVLIQAANAVEPAHQESVTHRDVKPATILLTPDSTAKLTDFGISRLVVNAHLIQTGHGLRTAQYLCPEQVIGAGANTSNDLYALGVVGYEVLTGLRPFEGDAIVATAASHPNRPPPQLPDTVPVGIHTVVSAALAMNPPADRPAKATSIANALGMPKPLMNSGTELTAPPTVPAPAQTTRTQALLALGLPAPTQAMTAQPMQIDPPGGTSRRLHWHPAWLHAAPDTIGGLAAFPAAGTTQTPVVTTTTAPLQVLNNVTGRPSTTTEISPPEKASPMPGQRVRARAEARGHDHKKDGKQ